MLTIHAIALLLSSWFGGGALPPAPGIVLPAKVVRVVDGDTLDVEVKFHVRVRLLDCWAPETSEPGGPESTANLKRLADGKDAVLFAPWSTEIWRMFTFGRVLGRVWVNGRDIGREQVASGNATAAKPSNKKDKKE